MVQYLLFIGLALHLLFSFGLFYLIRKKKICFTLAGFPLAAGIPVFGFLFVLIYSQIMSTPAKPQRSDHQPETNWQDKTDLLFENNLSSKASVQRQITAAEEEFLAGSKPARLPYVRRERAAYRQLLSPGTLASDLDVPIEEASLLYPTWRKRQMVMNYLEREKDAQKKQDTQRETEYAKGYTKKRKRQTFVSDAEYSSFLEKTRFDTDPEVSHYAASALAELRVSYE